ncbi:phosphoribosylformylglycinamidine cyclo-ligase [candidate division WOR-1 bacterium RIFOXYA12_FULL_52_29]|uniref:Phosphoribosylformylglycinamidine cyclo-ligase n=1 Tax=candidate division WOR-1 bacterium RIFOXYC12_FULL_54_18 TaxID=1802584 RepID=A0A1F4T424_UNCSA|nr:MAG: phosphoribosylformylglycinamidine cyclo-ligase [candidate division WOR-1 bacterium RIFOXYA2_FULL_51_19]OGC17021.1 MAG: phosphoribosylformylglycinamidine cyclo-ligase [candidate division WOR-1 bacterium RIFOXYA12_FULL_52_29]OGC25882.1 MAG: phosphoribosylformylglycinamidine cyclo-ligase [candidate division WOR-1 bacterium RIFOXYB2_FULL_45_9]OGC27438.1 MAG: phosphoribosylformylglycinamidine cyclo-ligase [candidate division WOR-1 bacterium RIFOXYC12_FULL_54_18]OGC29349.1 MAG: phosphoribosyl
MITYKQAGVDIEAGYEVVRRIKKVAKGIGSFGGLFPFGKQYLVGATDGVGTKLKLAFMLNKHDTIGIDLVAMNVDDVVAMGAKPLFFLDYIGTQKVEPGVIEKIVKGIVEGCRQSGVELVGGETAELPDMYHKGEYDLAGFAVGVVDKNKVINGSTIREGDKIIGLASSGLHSNGYTLARKVIFEKASLGPGDKIDDFNKSIGEVLLTPTRIYAALILELINKFTIKGIAHVTGGGIPENLGRVIPPKRQAVIELNSWEIPRIFKLIKKLGEVDHAEMYKTFNMGIGMILVVPAKETDKLLDLLAKKKEKAFLIGEISKGNQEVIII